MAPPVDNGVRVAKRVQQVSFSKNRGRALLHPREHYRLAQEPRFGSAGLYRGIQENE